MGILFAPLGEMKLNSASVANPTMFQSAPLTEARGDLPEPEQPPTRSCFNPLPSPKQGEIFLEFRKPSL